MAEPVDFGRLMKGVIPYLTCESADDAIAFYEKAFGAIQHGPSSRDPAGKVLNATLEINEGIIMLVDHFPEMGGTPAAGGAGFMMQIVTHEGAAFWDRAIGAGCKIVSPFEPQFWGDTWGLLKDPFGVEWGVNQPSPANMAQAEAMKEGSS